VTEPSTAVLACTLASLSIILGACNPPGFSTTGSTSSAPSAAEQGGSGVSSSPSCPKPPTVVWDNGNQGHNGHPGAILDTPVPACSTLMVTSGQMTLPDGTICGYSADQLCVLVEQFSAASEASVSGLISGHTWYGITRSPPAAALADKKAQFFSGSNCANGQCLTVRIWQSMDGGALTYQSLQP
jgi:hypothetical protein